MKTITIRGITPEMDREIKQRARDGNLSINEWLLRMLRQWTGLEKKPMFQEQRDLDALAGTWSAEEAEELTRTLQCFEQIDEEQWR